MEEDDFQADARDGCWEETLFGRASASPETQWLGPARIFPFTRTGSLISLSYNPTPPAEDPEPGPTVGAGSICPQ